MAPTKDLSNTGIANSASIPQFNGTQLALFVLLPISWWIIVLYVIAPFFLPGFSTPNGEMNGWGIMLFSTLAYLFEFSLALFIFHREGYSLRLRSLKERIHWHWPVVIQAVFIGG